MLREPRNPNQPTPTTHSQHHPTRVCLALHDHKVLRGVARRHKGQEVRGLPHHESHPRAMMLGRSAERRMRRRDPGRLFWAHTRQKNTIKQGHKLQEKQWSTVELIVHSGLVRFLFFLSVVSLWWGYACTPSAAPTTQRAGCQGGERRGFRLHIRFLMFDYCFFFV